MSEALRRSALAAAAAASGYDNSFSAFGTRTLAGRPGRSIAGNLRSVISLGLRVADLVILLIVAAASYGARNVNPDQPNLYVVEVIIAFLLSMMYLQWTKIYNPKKLGIISFQLYSITVALCGVASTLAMFDYFLKMFRDISRIWLVIWLCLSLISLSLVRFVVWHAIRRLHSAGRFATPIAILGVRQSISRLVETLSAENGKSIDVVGVFDADENPTFAFQQLVETCKVESIDEVLIPLPWTGPTPLETFLRPLRNLPVTVRLVPEMPKTAFACLSFGEQCGLPAISVLERPLSGPQIALKRCEDLIICCLALTIASPVILLVALAVKLDSPGPVLFKQDRWGFNARKIKVLKFRTMRINGDEDPAVTQAVRNDARVTRVGRLLRRSSLDELPQLINVLRGDMSLVGPRPHAVPHNEHYMTVIDNYLGRHRVKPGITGLAQVNGCRGLTDTIEKMQRRVTYDLRYIDSWSLLLDLKVILMTVIVGFTNKNAF